MLACGEWLEDKVLAPVPHRQNAVGNLPPEDFEGIADVPFWPNDGSVSLPPKAPDPDDYLERPQ